MIWVLEGNYGQGWIDLAVVQTRAEVNEQWRRYERCLDDEVDLRVRHRKHQYQKSDDVPRVRCPRCGRAVGTYRGGTLRAHMVTADSSSPRCRALDVEK